jgi:hypothetical protein
MLLEIDVEPTILSNVGFSMYKPTQVFINEFFF